MKQQNSYFVSIICIPTFQIISILTGLCVKESLIVCIFFEEIIIMDNCVASLTYVCFIPHKASHIIIHCKILTLFQVVEIIIIKLNINYVILLRQLNVS